MLSDREQAEVDGYLEYWHQEGEGQAMHDAWLDSTQPYDFTGASYLEEHTRPLRETTPLMERFTRRVDCNCDTSVEFEEFVLEPDRDNLQFMLDIDERIFHDGDYFLREDPGFLDDLEKVDIVALGAVLAETSMRHLCFDFWSRLRALGPTPQMVREARGWWLLANIELEPENDFYSDRLDDALAEFHPKVEKIVAVGGFAVEGFASDGWEVFSVTKGLAPSTKKDMLVGYLNRDKAAVDGIYDRAASGAEAQARKKGHGLFLRGRTKRVWDCLHEPELPCDTSFLQFVGEWDEVTSRESSKGGTWTGISRAVRHRRGRTRCSRRPRRTAGSRRSGSSRDDGGGDDGGGDPDPEPVARTGAYSVYGARTQWDATMTSIGVAIGAGVMDVKGMIIGGCVSYFWARHRWPGDS